MRKATRTTPTTSVQLRPKIPTYPIELDLDQCPNCVRPPTYVLTGCFLMALLPADVYRTMFKFGVFNAVQSTCIDPVRTVYPAHSIS